MSLQVIGAGTGRTATSSLKLALEQLLGAPCYHMTELFDRPDDIPGWHRAAFGHMPDWGEFLAGYSAAVDWPASAFWPELSAAFPEALVLLSVRDGHAWWDSARQTIYAPHEGGPGLWREMVDQIDATRFDVDITDRDAAIKAYETWNQKVRTTVPPHRLLEWQLGDGWEPICHALELPVPDESFPHTNTKEEWKAREEARHPIAP